MTVPSDSHHDAEPGSTTSASWAVISVVVLFQPEFRHGLTQLGRSPFAKVLRRFGFQNEETASVVIDETMKAARRFSKNRTGSLIVIEREVGLQPYVDRGVQVDAGDMVVADEEGIVVVPAARQDTVLEAARARAAKDAAQSLDVWEAGHRARIDAILREKGFVE